jgi:uncharacterized repeat protein (TIGR03803 family)
MRKLRLVRVVLFVLAIAGAAHAQFSLLYNLGSNAGDPTLPTWVGNFVQGRDGNLYSTSPTGGSGAYPYEGTVFQLTPAGTVKVLHNFTDVTAYSPQSGLTLGTDGNLYGTTAAGFNNNNGNAGTIFRISTSGAFKVLHYFNTGIDGSVPYAPPIQATDGNFYGTTGYGKNGVFGSVYKMTPTGGVTPLVANLGGHAAGIMQGTDGNFYGTVRPPAGTARSGVIFRMTPAGKYTVLHNFNGYPTDGYDPAGTVIQASDGNFYGTTVTGGTNNTGTIYKITPAGAYKVLFTFPPITDGRLPIAGLVQGTDGYLYGIAGLGGTDNRGTLFRVTYTGAFTVVYNVNYTDGCNAQVPLFQHTNGTFFSDSYECGTHSEGVVYSLKVGLHPFIALVTTLGKAGQTIEILGNGLTGTTSVKFGTGSATSFIVVSDTYMTAVVPATGTTGVVTVGTPSGFRVSSKKFRVLPVISSFSPTGGPVGSQVVITGTGLTQTTKVTFGGVAATNFTQSATQVTAIVPSGAVTGKIGITTSGGVATSSGTFTVTNSLPGRCVVSNGKMTGYCVGVRGGVCREAFDPTNCPQGQSVTNVVLDQCAQSTFTVDGSRACTP